MTFDVTLVTGQSKIVRILTPGERYDYSQAIVVTEMEDGEALFLQMWLGKPLSPAQWRAAAGQLFPRARKVQFERRCYRTGAFRMVTLSLRDKR